MCITIGLFWWKTNKLHSNIYHRCSFTQGEWHYNNTLCHTYQFIMKENHHHQAFVSLLSEEPLSALCSATLIFGNMALVWTYSLIEIILPTSFWMTPRLLMVLLAPLCHVFGPPVVFQSWDMPCPSVLVYMNLVDNVSDAYLWVDPAHTFSIMQY